MKVVVPNSQRDYPKLNLSNFHIQDEIEFSINDSNQSQHDEEELQMNQIKLPRQKPLNSNRDTPSNPQQIVQPKLSNDLDTISISAINPKKHMDFTDSKENLDYFLSKPTPKESKFQLHRADKSDDLDLSLLKNPPHHDKHKDFYEEESL